MPIFSSQLEVMARRPNRSSRRRGCILRPSADLAGRSVGISPAVPAAFEAPLAAHHRAIGRWAAPRAMADQLFSRQEAQYRIEQMFDAEVIEILRPVEMVNLRVCALIGDADRPPALAVICDDVGQLDLGWIEKTNLLSDTMFGSVAPVGWRATAYAALVNTLGCTLPVFGYNELVEEIANYYWDGETDDEGARKALEFYHGTDEDEAVIDAMLPSAMHAQRPDFMLAENTTALKKLPAPLAKILRRLREAHKALQDLEHGRNAWRYDSDELFTYRPELTDYSNLEALTIVPVRHFQRELDEVGRFGMETGFMDTAGLLPLVDATALDHWFASLRLGAEYLVAVQDLIAFDPVGR